MSAPPFIPAVNSCVLLAGTDASTWQVLRDAEEILARFGLDVRKIDAVSIDPARCLSETAACAVIVASPDAELPGRWAAATGLPVLRVPVVGEGGAALKSLVEKGNLPAGPSGGEFATFAVGAAGAKNAALFLVATLALHDADLRSKWLAFREEQTTAVLNGPGLTLDA